MWRLVYAKRKLTSAEKQAMEIALDGLSFSCGSELQNADISPDMKMLCVSRNCSVMNQLKNSIIQQTSKISASTAPKKCQESQEYYSQCSNCSKPRIPRKKRSN